MESFKILRPLNNKWKQFIADILLDFLFLDIGISASSADGWTLTVTWKRMSMWRFFFLAHDCQPMCTVQEEKCPIYADTHVLFQLGLRFSIGNTLCNLKDSSQWFKQYFSNLFWQEHEIDPDVINPTFSFQSPGCFLEMPTFPNTVNSQWIKSVVLTYIFSCWMKKNIHIFPLICVKYVANVSLCSF